MALQLAQLVLLALVASTPSVFSEEEAEEWVDFREVERWYPTTEWPATATIPTTTTTTTRPTTTSTTRPTTTTTTTPTTTTTTTARPPSQLCSKPGTTCGNCKEVVLCSNTSGTWWNTEVVATCRYPLTCNKGQCSLEPTPQCAVEGMTFQCVSGEGMYPDPINCKKFHYCIPIGSQKWKMSSKCLSDYNYNPLTTYCDVPAKNSHCHPIVPVCKKPAQSGPLGSNPTLYYVCKPYYPGKNLLYPFLYLCPNGKVYDGNYGCREREVEDNNKNTYGHLETPNHALPHPTNYNLRMI